MAERKHVDTPRRGTRTVLPIHRMTGAMRGSKGTEGVSSETLNPVCGSYILQAKTKVMT